MSGVTDAQVEAGARYPDMAPETPSVRAETWQHWRRDAFIAGAEWSRSQPAPRTVSAEQIKCYLLFETRPPQRSVPKWLPDLLAALGITVEAPRG